MAQVEASPATRLRMIEDWEKDMEVQDRYSLMAYGLKRKAAWLRKKTILDTVFELKRRFRVVLFTYLRRRDDKKFAEL